MAEITEERLLGEFGEAISESSHAFAEFAIIIDKKDLHRVVTFLRDDPDLRYRHLSDITVADWPQRQQRFDLVYHLYSFELGLYIRVKVRVAEDEVVESLTGEWDSADWLEREVYDMFGIGFSDHPDLRRILMWPEFEGHPLRRDFPLTYEMPRFSHNKDNPPEVIK